MARTIPCWDEYFFTMIDTIKIRSKDPSTQVGCVIVGPNHEIRSTGYNGPPLGVDFNQERTPERFQRVVKYKFIEHAERNAIFFCARTGTPLDGCKIYQSWLPCCDCARAIIQAGISEIIIDGQQVEQNAKYWNERWFDSMCASVQMCVEAKVRIRIYKPILNNKEVHNLLDLNNCGYQEFCNKYNLYHQKE